MLPRHIDTSSGYAAVPQHRVPLSGVWSPIEQQQQQQPQQQDRLFDWQSSLLNSIQQQGTWQQNPYNFQRIQNGDRSAIQLPQLYGRNSHSLGLLNNQHFQTEKLDAFLRSFGSTSMQLNRAQWPPTNTQAMNQHRNMDQDHVHRPNSYSTEVESNNQFVLADHNSRKTTIAAPCFPPVQPITQTKPSNAAAREVDIAAYALLSLDHKRKRTSPASNTESGETCEPELAATGNAKRVATTNRTGVHNDKNMDASSISECTISIDDCGAGSSGLSDLLGAIRNRSISVDVGQPSSQPTNAESGDEMNGNETRPISVKSGFASPTAVDGDDTCKHPEGCVRSGKGKTKGLCTKHGGHKKCTYDKECPKQAVKKGVCCAHGGSRKCTHISGCQKHALWRGLCSAHGGARLCTHESGCKKLVTLKGLCTAHGGRRSCEQEDCTKLAISKGLCIGHGGGKRCTHDSGCEKRVVSRELCAVHGGRKRLPCIRNGCEKKAISRGICFEHGGGTKCSHDSGCESRAMNKGKCVAHGGGSGRKRALRE